jgi:hypothetical protein
MVESPPSKHEALSSNSPTTENNTTKNNGGEEVEYMGEAPEIVLQLTLSVSLNNTELFTSWFQGR